MAALSQTTAAEPQQVHWLPNGVVATILQRLYDSTTAKEDVLHALLVCKQWAATAESLTYALDLDYTDGGSLAYDLPGVSWLLRRSKRVVALSIWGDSGAASGTLRALPWDNLKRLDLQGPADSFALDSLGDFELEKGMRGHQRAHFIQTHNDAFYLCATHPWDGLPAATNLPCLERLVIDNYALLDWRFPVQLS